LLKLRVVTALMLLAVLLPVLFQPSPSPFIGLALVFLSAGVWEWGRMNGYPSRTSVLAGIAFGGVLVAGWHQWGLLGSFPVWTAAAVFWCLVVPLVLNTGISALGATPRSIRMVTGILVLATTWLALAHARSTGINYLLSVMALVWVADIAAYFGGKAFGRRKLAPAISPGKSWEGALSGWVAVLLLAATWIWIDAHVVTDSLSIYSSIYERYPLLSWVVFSVLTALSVMGDLVESLVKRSAGFKDSSNLLPGHGGVLDRIDALLPVLPVAAFFSGM
jgi:phosphatidate cytidylyltransferase